MSDDTMVVDNDVDSGVDSSVDSPFDAEGSSQVDSGDEYGQMQERMSATEGEGWFYSDSVGKVVTNDGDDILDDNGKPFTRAIDYLKYLESKTTAKPEASDGKQAQQANQAQQNQQGQVKKGKSFDEYAFKDGKVSPEALYSLAKSGSDYQYKDDLVPTIEQVVQNGEQKTGVHEKEVDPVEAVTVERSNVEKLIIGPIEEIKNAMLENGAPSHVVEAILRPIIQNHTEELNKHYSAKILKAQEDKIAKQYEGKLTQIESEKLNNVSRETIGNLAKKYYPEGGSEQFFALVNGYDDGNGNFVRGIAAPVLDLLVNVASNGKPFKSDVERNSFYKDNFTKITADPKKAQALFDIAHHYFLGKKFHDANKMVFEKGKQSAIQNQNRAAKTIKARPASYSQAGVKSDMEGAPKILKDIMGIE